MLLLLLLLSPGFADELIERPQPVLRFSAAQAPQEER